jgi:hypothetical protein
MRKSMLELKVKRMIWAKPGTVKTGRQEVKEHLLVYTTE